MFGHGFLWSFRENLLVVYTLQLIVLWRKHSKVFFKKWNDNQKPQKIREKGVGEWQVVQSHRTGWDRLQYVGQVGLGQGNLHIGGPGDRMGLGQARRGLPAEPVHLSQNGTTTPCKIPQKTAKSVTLTHYNTLLNSLRHCYTLQHTESEWRTHLLYFTFSYCFLSRV